MISFFYLHLIKLKICTNTFMFFPTLALDFLILVILIDAIYDIIKNILETVQFCNEQKYKTIKKEEWEIKQIPDNNNFINGASRQTPKKEVI